MRIVGITGADRGLGFSLCEKYLQRGDTVLAGRFMPDWKELDGLKEKYPDRLYILPLDVGQTASVQQAAALAGEYVDHMDILINCAGIDGHMHSVREGQDYDNILRVINVNALGTLRVTEAFLPLLDRGQDKKICCVSSEAGSIGTCWRDNEVEYCMSKAALNMGMAVFYNDLKKDGYDIRLYHPGWMKTYMLGYKSEDADLEASDAADLAVRSFEKPKDGEKLQLDSYDGTVIPW